MEKLTLDSNCPDCDINAESRQFPFPVNGKTEYIIFPCECADKRQEEEEREERRKRKEQAKLDRIPRSGILKGMTHMTLDKWRDRPELRKQFLMVSEYCKDIKERVSDGEGLIMVGPPGNGKTHLSVSVARAAIEHDIHTRVVNSTELLRSLRPHAEDQRGAEDNYLHTDLLLIDDLGKEKWSEWVEETLYHIINYRMNDLKSTIITTNFTGDQLAERIGQATVDRLRHMCKPVVFEASSQRGKS